LKTGITDAGRRHGRTCVSGRQIHAIARTLRTYTTATHATMTASTTPQLTTKQSRSHQSFMSDTHTHTLTHTHTHTHIHTSAPTLDGRFLLPHVTVCDEQANTLGNKPDTLEYLAPIRHSRRTRNLPCVQWEATNMFFLPRCH
jgi:hypothetical protein